MEIWTVKTNQGTVSKNEDERWHSAMFCSMSRNTNYNENIYTVLLYHTLSILKLFYLCFRAILKYSHSFTEKSSESEKLSAMPYVGIWAK